MADQQRTTGQEMASYLRGLARGLGPDLVGGPVDLARDALNLGIGGASWLGQKAGALEQPLPQIQPGAVGDSDWWARLTNVGDDQTPQYTAGRLTPIGASVAAAVASPVKRLVNAMASRPAPNSPRAQEGAIRLGGRPDLMPSHDTTVSKMHNAQGSSGVVELYAPSIGITKDRIMSEFSLEEPGGITLIPRVGAFDPATSPSTLFNRDAYTARWRDFTGKPVGKTGEAAMRPAMQALGVKNTREMLQKVVDSDWLDLGKFQIGYFQGAADPLRADEIRRLETLRRYGVDRVNRALELRQAGRMDEVDPELNRNIDWFMQEAINFKLPFTANLREEARDRLVERLGYQGKELAVKENLKSDLPKLWDGDVSGDFSHDVAMKRSPAFRSFEQYERHPLGAALLTEDTRYPYQLRNEQIVRTAQDALMRYRAPDGSWPELDRREIGDILQAFVRAGQTKEGFLNDPKQMGLVMRDILKEHWSPAGPLSAEGERYMLRALKAVPEFQRQAGNVLREYARAPSSYAELKVSGPVPVTGENWAGAILRSLPDEQFEMDRVLRSLNYNNVPVVKSKGPKTDFKIADQLQKDAGPARKIRMFER